MRPALPIALVLLAPLLSACNPPTATTDNTRTVMVHIAENAPKEEVVLTGEIRARHEVDLAFRVGGKVQARLVDVGSEIHAGQTLLRLDPEDLQLQARTAKAQLAAAESELATTRAERDRHADLLARRFISQAAFDQRQHAFNAAQARHEQALAQHALASNQTAYGKLSSDFPGVVSAVLVDSGQIVAPGQAVLRLAREGEREILVAVPESQRETVRLAQQFSIKLWVDPNTVIPGELRELGAVADSQTRSYPARIRLLNPPAQLSLGMTAQVSIGKPDPAAGIRVPLTAVGNDGKAHFVWVVEDNKLRRKPVELAAFREDGAILAAGLQAGEAVVIAGIQQLVADSTVKTVRAPAPAEQR